MATENSRRIPLEKAASIDDFNDAINNLTSTQLKRLKIFALWRVRGLGRRKTGRDWQDLFHETVSAFCSGERRWNKDEVDIIRAMTEAMRSISSNWKRKFDEDEPRLESEFITTTAEGVESNPLQNVFTPDWNTQKELESQETIKEIEDLVSSRETASLIVMGWKEGMTGAQIKEDLKISQNTYETETKWIRRTVRAKFEEQADA